MHDTAENLNCSDTEELGLLLFDFYNCLVQNIDFLF